MLDLLPAKLPYAVLNSGMQEEFTIALAASTLMFDYRAKSDRDCARLRLQIGAPSWREPSC